MSEEPKSAHFHRPGGNHFMQRPASLPSRPGHDPYHVVLVEPGDSLNVGSVARAMSNLGFSHLHLVAPPRLDMERAATTACWATDLLQRARIHQTLEEALDPMQQVVGFTARHGRNRPRHLVLPDWVGEVMQGPPVTTALLFGPEDHGLRSEQLTHCRWLVRIPSTEDNPSYNLAQAVLLVLFELSRTRWAEIEPETPHPAATWRDFYELERMVGQVMKQVGFYGKGTPAHVPGLVNHLLRRTDPDGREMHLLLGMFGKIERALAGRVPVNPAQQETPHPLQEGRQSTAHKEKPGIPLPEDPVADDSDP